MPGVEYSDTFDAFLPRVTLSYHPMDNSTVWATYSEGNMPGFFNTDIVPLSESELAALEAVTGQVSLFNEEETLKNYEIGWKQQLLDGRLFYSLIAYQFDWVNLKTRVGVPIVLDNGNERTLNVQFNSGDAEIRGIELEGGFAIGENLTGTFMVEHTSGEYGTFTCGFSPFKRPIDPANPFGARDCTGLTPARYPDISGAVGLNWYDQLGSSQWEYYIRGLATYFGKAYSEEANFAWYGKYWRVSARAGFEKEGVRFEGYVLNLLDDDSYEAASRWSDFSTGICAGFLFCQGIAATPAT
jgi:iron complex outermembrane receptor protein